jgi:hypothetical protein
MQSDSAENAEKEIKLWFSSEEIIAYQLFTVEPLFN